jgi:hypothetical protein
MIRTAIVTAALTAGLLIPSDVTGDPIVRAAQAPAPVSAADAAPFLGEWTLDLQGDNGPGTFDLIVKVEKEKVVGEITGGTLATQPIADVTKNDQSLLLSYSFNWEGSPIDAVVRLTPAPEGKTNAQIAFAGGAYIMSGTATRKAAKAK